ncbi:MAG: hypothetical protein ACK4V1_12110 [Burkholderiaceae bacterium]
MTASTRVGASEARTTLNNARAEAVAAKGSAALVRIGLAYSALG